jgi:WD40 repeat protein
MSVSLKGSVTSLAFSGTGILSATASADGTADGNFSATLLNAANGKILRTLSLAAANMNLMDPLRFSPDGRQVAIIHNRSIWLYRLGTPSAAQARYVELRGDVPGNISEVSFTPNDKELLCVTDTYPAIYSWKLK